MVYEVKVNELAEEFGVHRNTIRNWINSGTLPAQKAPGRRYLIQEDDYLRLCEKFGRKPQVPGAQKTEEFQEKPQHLPGKDTPKVQLSLTSDLTLATPTESCTTCGSCASACPLTGVDGLDPRKIVRMSALGLNEEILDTDWPWKCTLCGRCEEACPMNIEIVTLMRTLRSLRKKAGFPIPFKKGLPPAWKKEITWAFPKLTFCSSSLILERNLTRPAVPALQLRWTSAVPGCWSR